MDIFNSKLLIYRRVFFGIPYLSLSENKIPHSIGESSFSLLKGQKKGTHTLW